MLGAPGRAGACGVRGAGQAGARAPMSETRTSVIDSGTLVRLADIFGGFWPWNRGFWSETRTTVMNSGTLVRLADTNGGLGTENRRIMPVTHRSVAQFLTM